MSLSLLVHDSRLFSDIDPRQRAILFRIAAEATEKIGCQYIATVNEDQLEGVRDQFSVEEFEVLLSKRVRLELIDDSPESKLLGIQVDY
jgi:uncharacterized protein YydD (DUF2326 family)